MRTHAAAFVRIEIDFAALGGSDRLRWLPEIKLYIARMIIIIIIIISSCIMCRRDTISCIVANGDECRDCLVGRTMKLLSFMFS